MFKPSKAWGLVLAFALMTGLPAMAFAADEESIGNEVGIDENIALVSENPSEAATPQLKDKVLPYEEARIEEIPSPNDGGASGSESITDEETPESNVPAASDAPNTKYTKVDSLTLNKQDLYTNNAGDLLTKDDSGKYTTIKNVRWDNSNRTLTMNGANIGALDAMMEVLNVFLANGTKNFMAGNQIDPILMAKTLNISGTGTLTITQNEINTCVYCAEMNVNGGANIILRNATDKFCDSIDASRININDGTIQADREVAVFEKLVVNKKGALIVDADKSMICLSDDNYPDVEVLVNGGLLKIINRTPMGSDVHSRGIDVIGSIIVNGGSLIVETNGFGINSSTGKIKFNGGNVKIDSKRMQAINSGSGDEGSITITGGNVELFSTGTTTFATNNFTITGGRLHSIVRNPTEDACAGMAFNKITVGKNMKFIAPNNGYAAHNDLGYYDTFFNEDGTEAVEVIIEDQTPKPNPDPTPSPDPKPNPGPNNDQAPVYVEGSVLPATGDISPFGLLALLAIAAFAFVGTLKTHNETL